MQTAYIYIRFSHEEQRLGGSERRQLEAAVRYAREKGMIVDYSLKPDRAISAYRGKHRRKGNLSAFVEKIKSGEVKPGSALIVESLDRLSREEPEDALYFLLDLVRADLEVHCILDQKVYRKGRMAEIDLIDAILKQSGYSRESRRKSERCAEEAAKQREKARKGICFSARVPGWLVGTKNGEIVPHSQHAKTVRYIFKLASQRIGCTRIVDILNKERIPAFNRKKCWYDMYISEILRTRAVLGEYQPGTHPRGGTWAPAGDPIPNYYPRIIDDDLWQRVQEIRAGNWAHGKVQVGKYHGSGRSTWRNLFTGLVVDEDSEPLIYKTGALAYLISSNRAKFKTHKIRYQWFEEIMLTLFREDIKWPELIVTDAEQIQDSLKPQLVAIENKIIELERHRKRYLKLIEGEAEPDEEIFAKYRSAAVELKRLKENKDSLERRINATAAPTLTNIPKRLFLKDKNEANLELKDEIRRRVARICLYFNSRVIIRRKAFVILLNDEPWAPDYDGEAEAFFRKNYGIRSGKRQIVATITFTNGAENLAIIDGNRATLFQPSTRQRPPFATGGRSENGGVDRAPGSVGPGN
jgi:DNA invertase Pin-like site-specific DNA recombinase